ncbi:MAG: TorF family putative porin [Woeseia sp.]
MKIANTSLLLPVALLFSLEATAELNANIGWVSDYYYRGIFQHASSASAGLDFEKNGFYAGSWAADVGDGLEVDTYFGWNGEIGDVSIGGGFTGYYYTGDFDDTYEELNFSLGYGIASAEVAVGKYDNFSGPKQDYTYYAITLEKEGFYGKYAGFSQDFAGNYVELGYGASLEVVDLSIALVLSDKDLVGTRDEALVFGISKSFQLD